MLRHLPTPRHPDLLVGTASGDDAAVWRVSEDKALVATVDVFTPVVDDARTWGAIAAANAASDVYAMGGTPTFALNIAGWPRDDLSLDLLADVLQGAAEVAETGKWFIVGGHTIDSAEPFFGQSVIGEVHPDRIISNDAAKPGQLIILTKPIGTGLLTTAAKRSQPEDIASGGWLNDSYTAAIASMTRLNDVAAGIARSHDVRAGTDITGFGLLGHLHRLAAASGVLIDIATSTIPLLPNTTELLAAGMVPGGTVRNLEYVWPHLDAGEDNPSLLNLLADPQTSGGLALCINADQADDALAQLLDTGHQAAVIATISAHTDDNAQVTLRIRS